VIRLRKNKKIFPLVLIAFLLLPFVFGAQVNTFVAKFSDVTWVDEDYSTAQVAAILSSKSIDADKTVTRSFLGNITGIITNLQRSSGRATPGRYV